MTIAPLAFNELPNDPGLDDLDKELDALAEKYGCAIVFIAYKPDGKMMISGSGIDANPCPPSEMFKTKPAQFFANVAFVCEVGRMAQDAENAMAGHA